MANYISITNGNWGDLATWEDDSLGYFTASTALPTSSDDVYANTFTITIDGTRFARTIRNTTYLPPTVLGSMSIPQMTSNTTPSGTVISGGVGGQGNFNQNWFAFDRLTFRGWASNTANTGWIGYQFPSGRIIKRYGFLSHSSNGNNIRTWTFEGSNDGSTWATLDTQTNFTTGVSTFHSFDISANTTSYIYYRFNITAVQTLGQAPTIIEIEMSEVTNLYGSASPTGGFTFANGGNLTCALTTNSVFTNSVAFAPCLTFDLPSGQSATFNGDANDAPINANNARSILVQNTGTFNMSGAYGLLNNLATARYTIFINGSPTINLVGSITCNQTQFASNSTLFVNTGSNPTINITGNVSGGLTNTINAATGMAIHCASSATINLTGDITTNSCPTIWFNTSGTLNVIGNITGGAAHPAILNAVSPITISITGTLLTGVGYPAIQGLANTFVIVRGNVINTDTYNAIWAGRVTIDDNVTSWQYKNSTNTITRTLYTPGVSLGNPAEINVRSGTTYGPNLELTGNLTVPNPNDVLQGVATDNTVGTLLMTPADFWNYLISNGFTTGSIGERLKESATTDIVGNIVASFNS